jgi:hypothetical protein
VGLEGVGLTRPHRKFGSEQFFGSLALTILKSGNWVIKVVVKPGGRIFSRVRPFYECAVSDLDP